MKLNEAQKAALVAGATMEVVMSLADPTENEPTAEELAAQAAAQAQAEAAAKAEKQVPADLETAQARVAELETAAATHTTELATAQACLTEVQTKLATAEANAQTATTQIKALAGIVAAQVDSMVIAMGGSAGATKDMSTGDLLTKYTATSTEFKSKFRPGRQVTPAPNAKEVEKTTVQQARMMRDAAAFNTL